jgi:hypothetical protein
VSGSVSRQSLPALGHPGGDLDSRRKAQFGEDVLDMTFRGPLGDHHLCGYLAVTQPVRDEVGDLEFPRRQPHLAGGTRACSALCLVQCKRHRRAR